MKALIAAQAEMGASVTKDSKNPFFKSTYATLNAVLETVVPVLNAHKIFVGQLPALEANGEQVIVTTLTHESGQFMNSTMRVTLAKMNDPQAAGSGISYARRYALMSMLSLGAEDDDGEAAMGRQKTYTPPPAKSTPAPVAPKAEPPKVEAPKVEQAKVTETPIPPTPTEAPKRASFKKPAAPAPVKPEPAKTESTGDDWE